MNGGGGAAGRLGLTDVPCRAGGGGGCPAARIKLTPGESSRDLPQRHNFVGPWARRASSQKLPSPAQPLMRRRLGGHAGS